MVCFLYRGSGRAVNLSRVSFDPTDDALILTGYTSFLDSSVLVIGAVLAGTGECEIGDVIAFNASTREIETEGSISCLLLICALVCVYSSLCVYISVLFYL